MFPISDDVILVDGCAGRCHDGPGQPCSELGGCGSIHASRQRRDHASVVAQVHAAATAAAGRAQGRTAPLSTPYSPDEHPEPGAWPPLTDDDVTELRQRRCARDHRCPDKERACNPDGTHAHAEHEKGPRKVWLGAQISVERGLCSTCDRAVRADLPKLVADWVELNTLLAPGSGGTGDKVSSSRELPVNIRVGVEAVQKAIDDESSAWASVLAERLGVDWDDALARASRPAIRVQRAVHLVAGAVDTLLALEPTEHLAWEHGEPVWDDEDDVFAAVEHDDGRRATRSRRVQATVERDGIDGAIRLLDLHDKTAQIALRHELKHHLPAPCPNPQCGRLALVRYDGKDHVECEACRERWSEDDYVRLVAVLSSEETLRIKQCRRCDKTGRGPDRRMCDHEAAA